MILSELAKKHRLSKHSLWRCVKSGRLKATKVNGVWKVTEEDYEKYISGRYSRFTEKKHCKRGIYSPKKCSEIIGCTRQRIYYLLRKGKIKSTREGIAWIIKTEDLNEYIATYKPQKDRWAGVL